MSDTSAVPDSRDQWERDLWAIAATDPAWVVDRLVPTLLATVLVTSHAGFCSPTQAAQDTLAEVAGWVAERKAAGS